MFKVIEGMKEIGQYTTDGAYVPGHALKLTGNWQVASQTDKTARSHGFAVGADSETRADGEPCTMANGPGGYCKTDNFTSLPAAGNDVAFDHATNKFKVAESSDFVLAHVVAVEDGIVFMQSHI